MAIFENTTKKVVPTKTTFQKSAKNGKKAHFWKKSGTPHFWGSFLTLL